MRDGAQERGSLVVARQLAGHHIPDSWDVGECAFCGSQCGDRMADLAGEIYRAAERLVEVAPRPPWFRCNTRDYIEALKDFARYVGVDVE